MTWNRRAVCCNNWLTNRNLFWSPRCYSFIIEFACHSISPISFVRVRWTFFKYVVELSVRRFRTSKPSRFPFLWSDLSKPLLQFIEHLSGEPEHDHVEKGCNGKSSFLHVGTCRRVRAGFVPFTKIKNIKIVKIIFSYLFLTELDLDRFYQNSWNHKTVRL